MELEGQNYLGRSVLSRMYCTSCSSLLLACWAVTSLVFSTPASRFFIDWSTLSRRSTMSLRSSLGRSTRRSVSDRLYAKTDTTRLLAATSRLPQEIQRDREATLTRSAPTYAVQRVRSML
jgi:hypothetical protein